MKNIILALFLTIYIYIYRFNSQCVKYNEEKLATYGTQEENNPKHKLNTICVGHHYAQTNTNNVIKT
jgi:hypothetical protein